MVALDAVTRSAMRAILRVTPNADAVDEPGLVPQTTTASEPPLLVRAEQLEPGPFVPRLVGDTEVGFDAFCDGTQQARIPAWVDGIPYVFGTVACAIRSRRDRRMGTWDGAPPAVEHRFYLPLSYVRGDSVPEGYAVVDTTAQIGASAVPTRHPAALVERAMQLLQQDRERLEAAFVREWIEREQGVLCADGSLPADARARCSAVVVGVVKSHRTIYADGDALTSVLRLVRGERTPVFAVGSGGKEAVASWYLRVRAARGHDALWGLVRVESALMPDLTARADVVSRWVLAESAPLALPDPRWDKMSYGVRDCESFLRAIS